MKSFRAHKKMLLSLAVILSLQTACNFETQDKSVPAATNTAGNKFDTQQTSGEFEKVQVDLSSSSFDVIGELGEGLDEDARFLWLCQTGELLSQPAEPKVGYHLEAKYFPATKVQTLKITGYRIVSVLSLKNPQVTDSKCTSVITEKYKGQYISLKSDYQFENASELPQNFTADFSDSEEDEKKMIDSYKELFKGKTGKLIATIQSYGPLTITPRNPTESILKSPIEYTIEVMKEAKQTADSDTLPFLPVVKLTLKK